MSRSMAALSMITRGWQPRKHRNDRKPCSSRPGRSIDHLAGAHEQRRRDVEAEGLGDGKLVLRRLLRWQFGWLCSLEDSIYVAE
jgi:hypothetical protein